MKDSDRIQIVNELKNNMPHAEEVLLREEKNRDMIARHPELIVGDFKDHYQYYSHAFGSLECGGTGVLDIGTGHAGVFLLELLSTKYDGAHIATDMFEAQAPEPWVVKIMPGQQILMAFGEKSFDYVQCIETLEHVGEAEGTDIARQMLAVSRKRCLITSMGFWHHTGPANEEIIRRNHFLSYRGQPNIEDLMNLGYKVNVINGYQIVAWHENGRTV